MKINRVYFKCISCGKEYDINEVRYRCDCGDLLDVVYEFDTSSIDPEYWKKVFRERRLTNNKYDLSGVWRYREFLQFIDIEKDLDKIVTMPEGNTNVFDAPKSAKYAGLNRLFLKHQGLNPTGSFKDNGMTTGTTMAKKLGFNRVACASTGNTSASMSAYASRAGMLPIVFIPGGKQIAYGKLSQALDYGALTLRINGDFDDAMKLVERVSVELGIYLLNSINPFRLEGQKTIIIELLDQLDWNVPDYIVVPGGNLGNNSSFGKALQELYNLGFIDKLPKVVVVQAEGANPLYRYFQEGKKEFKPVKAYTRATAIKIGNPVSWKKSVRTIEFTNGIVEQVTEEEIAFAKAIIGRDGIGCEPASATTVAGIKKLVEKGIIDKDAFVVGILTGNLLKDPDYTVEFHTNNFYIHSYYEKNYVIREGKIDTSKMANQPVDVEANIESIKKVIYEYEKKFLG